MRIGKFMENKIFFRDTTTGRRGIQLPRAFNAYYRLCWFQRVPVPARGTATNFGGTARYGQTMGGQGGAVGRVGSYAQTTWAHGLASVRGFMFFCPNTGGHGAGHATAPGSYILATLINATTVMVSMNNYTAATAWLHALIWGATAALY